MITNGWTIGRMLEVLVFYLGCWLGISLVVGMALTVHRTLEKRITDEHEDYDVDC